MGAWIGCIGIVLVVFFAGLCGLLAAWGGIITVNTDINLYMIQARQCKEKRSLPQGRDSGVYSC